MWINNKLQTEFCTSSVLEYIFIFLLPPAGRTPELRETLIEDFKRVVREQGMSEDTISIKENKGAFQHSFLKRGKNSSSNLLHRVFFFLFLLYLLYFIPIFLSLNFFPFCSSAGECTPGETVVVDTPVPQVWFSPISHVTHSL